MLRACFSIKFGLSSVFRISVRLGGRRGHNFRNYSFPRQIVMFWGEEGGSYFCRV